MTRLMEKYDFLILKSVYKIKSLILRYRYRNIWNAISEEIFRDQKNSLCCSIDNCLVKYW